MLYIVVLTTVASSLLHAAHSVINKVNQSRKEKRSLSSTQYSLKGLRAFIPQGPFDHELLFHRDECASGRQIFA